MSSEERKKILQMVADGKISADDAATLMRSLEETAEEEIEIIQMESGSSSGNEAEFEEVRRRAMRFAMIPLWLGILITIFSAWGMYGIQQNAGYNLWFFCLGMPLALGILFIALGAGGKFSRWLYVNVDRSEAEEWPRKITLAFPLPLGLVSWFLKNFGQHIDGLKRTSVDEIIQAIAMTKSITEPLVVNVDNDGNGDRVQVYIG